MTEKWQVSWDERALKELKKIDKQAQKDIIGYLKNRIATEESPRRFGKAFFIHNPNLGTSIAGQLSTIITIPFSFANNSALLSITPS